MSNGGGMNHDTDDLVLIEEALRILPRAVRDEYWGAAWLKLQKVQDRLPEERVKAVANHVEYIYNRDRRGGRGYAELHESIIDPSTIDPSITAEQRDLIAHVLEQFAPTDRTIVAMIAAEHSFREIAKQLKTSPSVVHERLKRVRAKAGAGGGWQ